MISVRKIAFVAIMAGITFASQILLAGLPNIEIVSVLFLICALSLKLSTSLMISIIFVLLEGLYWGFADWVIGYLYIWPLYIIIGYSLKRMIKTSLSAAFVNGLFGLVFGSLFALQYLLFFGPHFALSYIISGLLFDITHGISNFLLMLILFEPLRRVIILVKSKVGSV